MKAILASAATVLTIGAAAAQPFPEATAPTGSAYTFTAKASGGNGAEVFFTIPKLPTGSYTVSWNAGFKAQGTHKVPVEWSCGVLQNGAFVGSSSTLDNGDFFPGVSGTVSLRIKSGDRLEMICGLGTDAAWTWGTNPLQVTFVRLAQRSVGSLG